jgi:hypothetical protein
MTEMMEQLPPAWYRARIELYRQLQSSLDKDSGELKLVRNGVFPPERDEKAAYSSIPAAKPLSRYTAVIHGTVYL